MIQLNFTNMFSELFRSATKATNANKGVSVENTNLRVVAFLLP